MLGLWRATLLTQHSPSVPPSIRTWVGEWGLASDQTTGGSAAPWQLPPHLSCHSWRKNPASYPPSQFPEALSPRAWGGRWGKRLPRVSSQKLFRSPVWQVFVLTHGGYFTVIQNPVCKGDNQYMGLEVRRTRAPNPATSCCNSDRDLPPWASVSHLQNGPPSAALPPRPGWCE